jgi:protein SCO1/2
MSNPSSSPANAILRLGILAAIAIAVTLVMLNRPGTRPIPPELQNVLWPQPKPLQGFSLTDHHLQPFDAERLKGKWSFLFIGYTHCPDICPMALSSISSTFKLLPPEVQANTQVTFVSVDPERDSLEHLASYVGYFNEAFLGATGTQTEIDQFAKLLGAGYRKETPDASGAYAVTHTSSIFLVNPEGGVAGAFAMPHDPKNIASQYLQIREL